MFVQELAVSHCLSAESQSSQGATGPSGQSGQAVSFGAIDMYAKLVVLLVKVTPLYYRSTIILHISLL